MAVGPRASKILDLLAARHRGPDPRPIVMSGGIQSFRACRRRLRWRNLRVAASIGLAAMCLVSTAQPATARPTAAALSPRLLDIEISPASIELRPGDSGLLTATGIYEDGSEADLTSAVVWGSRDTDVASVEAGGIVRAVGSGRAEITAEEPASGRRASVNGEATVLRITDIALSPATASIPVGGAVQLRAFATLSDGTEGHEVTGVVEWITSRDSVAVVSNVEGTRGQVLGVSPGEADIRARDPDSGADSPNDQGLITVTPGATPTPGPGPTPTPTPPTGPIVLERIEIEPADVKLLPAGGIGSIRAIGYLTDGSSRDVTAEVEWESSNPNIVAVTVGGVLTGGESGRSGVDARHVVSGIDAEREASVWVGEFEGIFIEPEELRVGVGTTGQLSVERRYDNGLTEDITSIAEWISERERVATVSNAIGTKGRVTGVVEGDAVIVASDPATADLADPASALILVDTEPPAPTPAPGEWLDIDALRIEPLDIRTLPGEITQVQAIATLADGSEVDVTDQVVFLSDREEVATVSAGGRLLSIEAGRTKLDAYHPATEVDADERAEVWVGEIESIDLWPQDVSLLLDETAQLRALATYTNGLSEDITDQAEWSSEKTRVATVSNLAGSKGFVSAVTRGDAVIVARDPRSGKKSKSSSGKLRVIEEGVSDPGDIGDDQTYVLGLRSIVIDPAALHLMSGQTGFLSATGIYLDGSTRDLTPYVRFESRRSRVAAVDESGAVVAGRGGETSIYAIDPITELRTRVPARISVARVVKLEIWPPERTVGVGQETQLLALATFDNGVEGVDVTADVRWSSSRRSVAEIERYGAASGLLSPLELGETDITAQHLASRVKTRRSEGRFTVVDELEPTPTPVPSATPAPTSTPAPGQDPVVVSLRAEPSSVTLREGQIIAPTYSRIYSDDSVEVVTTGLEFRSENFRIARADSTGRILAEGVGISDIWVSDPESGLFLAVPVTVRRLTSLTLDPESIALRVGAVGEMRALASFSDGTLGVDVSDGVRWRSLDPLIAEVDQEGRVTALAEGTARIEVQDEETRVRSDVSVGAVQVVGEVVRVFVRPTTTAIRVGEEKNYKAYGVFADGTTVQITSDVLWSLEAGVPPMADISESGSVTALAPGDATIDATDRATGISSADSGDSGVLSVVGDVVGIKISTSSDIDRDPSEVILAAGETRKLRGLVQYAGRTDGFDAGSDLDWFSTNPSAVPVAENGLVTCVGVGVAVISAMDPDSGVLSTNTLGDHTVTCSGSVIGLRTTPDFRDLDYGSVRQCRAYRILQDGSEVEVTRKVIWSSSAPDIVSIVETGGDGGKATALGDGTATLYAYDQEFDISSAASGEVTVLRTRKTRVELELFPEDDNVGFVGTVGGIHGFQARVTYASGATQGVNLNLVWTSSDPSIVEMGDGVTLKVNQGRLLAPGIVTITGTYPADEASPSDLTAQITFQVQAAP
jgi:uncharacterized protein YjdB